MAGLEERLSKLESILHRLFCCDTNQFTGPQGPPGPQGPTGPAGPEGAIIFQNLNWMGAFTPCVVYAQFDAVSYNGSSYFLNCETNETFECEIPPDNPSCWILLANAGAPGATGPQGIPGNDGSNSGRWQYQGLLSTGLPGLSSFSTTHSNLSTLNGISINKISVGSADYTEWLNILNGLTYNGAPAFLQITEVGNNNVIGLYEVIGTNGFSGPLVNQSLNLDLNYIGGQAVNLVLGKQYTISWVLNGLGNNLNKTVGNLTASLIPGTQLIYDYNIVTSRNKVACVYLPDTTQIGKEVIVFARKLENLGFYIQSNSQITLDPIDSTPLSTGFITNFGIDQGSSFHIAVPNGNYKFTFLGNTAAGGKAFWNMEALPNTYFTNGVQFNLADASTILDNPRINNTTVTLTASSLNSLYPFLQEGEQIFAPNQPGGGKLFIKTATGWLSAPLNTVV